MRFGKGCSSIDIDVPPFDPICGHPEIMGSSPATFEVPLPALVPPTPPVECVCFDFSSPEVSVTKVNCNTAAKASVKIEPADEDCCTGRYVVTPHIEVPCMQFDIDQAVVTTTTVDGTVGRASLRIDKDCFGCKLKPYLDIEFPVPRINIPGICIPNLDTSQATISLSFRTANQDPATPDHEVSGTFIEEVKGKCVKPDHKTNSVGLGFSGISISCASIDPLTWHGNNKKGHVKYTYFDKSRERQDKISDAIIEDWEPEHECPYIGLADAEIDLRDLYVGAGAGLVWGGTTGDLLCVKAGSGIVLASKPGESATAVCVDIDESSPLFFSGNKLSLDTSELDVKTHTHGNITNDGKLKSLDSTMEDKVVITNPTGDIDAYDDLTVDRLYAVLGEQTLEIASSPTVMQREQYPTKFTVRSSLGDPAVTLIGSAGGFGRIELGYNVYTSTIESNDTATLEITGSTGITLDTTIKSGLIEAKPPSSAAKGSTSSTEVATCGWVTSNFSGGQVKSVAGVGPGDDGNIAKDGLVAALKGTGSDSLAAGDHTHGNISTDGKLTGKDDGNKIVTTGSDGKIGAWEGFEMADKTDVEVLTGMKEVCTYTNAAQTVQFGVPASRVVVVGGANHESTLTCFSYNSAGTGTLTELKGLTAGELTAIGQVFSLSKVEGEAPTVNGLKRAAFGTDDSELQAATVVFEEGGTTATLMEGLPLTIVGDDVEEGDVLAVTFDEQSATPYVTYAGFSMPPGSASEKDTSAVGYVLTANGDGTAKWSAPSVLHGEGMRRRNVNPSTHVVTYDTTPSTADGAIDVNYGRGLHLTTCSTVPNNNNKLELHVLPQDFAFYGSSATVHKATNARLAIDDTKYTAMSPADIGTTKTWYRRITYAGGPKELLITVLKDVYTDPGTGTLVRQYMTLRFLNNGVLLGCYDGQNTMDNITRGGGSGLAKVGACDA